jgi:hypothetical protein
MILPRVKLKAPGSVEELSWNVLHLSSVRSAWELLIHDAEALKRTWLAAQHPSRRRARPSQGSTGPRLKSEKSSSSFRDGVVSGASAGAVTKRTT